MRVSKKILKISVSTTLLTLLTFNLFSANISFEKLSVEDGISQVSVLSIKQDRLGNIWFGTRNGVNRYDGDNITVYTTIRNDSTSIIQNKVRKILTHNDRVWVQTTNALSYFDINLERFFNHTIEGIISFTLVDDKAWIANDTELFSSIENNDSIPLELHQDEKISALYASLGIIYIGTNQRVISCDISKNKQIKTVQENVNVSALFIDSRRDLWIGTISDGAFRVSPNKTITHFDGKKDLTTAYIRCFEEASDGNVWVGTFGGLYEVDLLDNIELYKYDKDVTSTISNNSVWSLFKDRSNKMWVGTYFGGINHFQPADELYHYYPENNQDNRGVNFSVVGDMASDKSNNLWICTEGGGLNYYDNEKQTFSYYTLPPNKYKIASQNLKSIYNHNDSILWISTHLGGFYSFDIKKQQFKSYVREADDKTYSSIKNTFSEIIPFKQGYIVGSHDGVYYFTPHNGEFQDVCNNEKIKYVLSLMLDKDSILWIGTELDGLFRYDFETNEAENYSQIKGNNRTLCNNQVYDIFQDADLQVWVGTSDGLNRYNKETNDFSYYSIDDGLPGNVILRILQIEPKLLMISTSQGISLFDVDKGVKKNLISRNGFPLKEINEGGLCLLPNGNVFVGGIDGMVSFNVATILFDKAYDPPRFTQLKVSNQIVKPLDKTEILNNSIMLTNSITLKHSHNDFSIRFTDGTEYNYDIEYKLEGFDDNWIHTSNNIANYTNLGTGKYVFILRNINNPDLKSQLQIDIKPPLYRTLVAFLLYVLLLVGIILYLNELYLARRRLKDKLLIQEREQENEHFLNQEKLKFFTNISHEFRTPLTLIAGQVEMLLENKYFKPTDYRKILNVHKNAIRLKSLISELLDFRKQEQGYLKLNVSECEFISFIEEIFYSFFELSKHANIDYKINYSNKPIHLWFDRDQMEKVFYNLLSNAFKFTPEHSQIIINIEEDGDFLLVEIIDSGKGMPQEYINNIFDRFYQLDNISTEEVRGTGIGLALTKGLVEKHKGRIEVKSKLNIGTTFSVYLPFGKSHFSDDEIKSVNLEKLIATNVIEEATPLLPPTKQKDITLLIVEDNVEVQAFLNELLSPLFEILTANNGLEGYNLAREQQPNIILSDVLMPQMSGTEMCSKLKTHVETSHIPIILLTARTAEEYKIEGLDTGADDYITKPFNTKILIARINNILNNRRDMWALVSQTPLISPKRIAKNSTDLKFMEKAYACLENNFEDSAYNVPTFAAEMNLGRTLFFSKIKAITGKTPNDFISTFRLEKSTRLMMEDSILSMSEVAYACGFTSPEYFSRTFKKQYGTTPSQYVKTTIED